MGEELGWVDGDSKGDRGAQKFSSIIQVGHEDSSTE